MSARILVVDDDASIRQTFAGHLGQSGYDVATAESAEDALSRFIELDPALVITDVRLPGMDGLELLARLKQERPAMPVLVITAHQDMPTAIGAMKAGAYDYLVKPLDLDQIDLLVERCLRERTLRRRVKQLTDAAAEPYALDRLIGREPAMIEIFKLIGVLATNRTSVLIYGETGTGKEVIARAIHFNSDRASEPLIAVNCTALPETLLESELFGHVRGAFTGAVADRRGHFERAGSGTIFLDEIGDTSLVFQAKLLRVLQEREFQPVGAERVRRTDARVIAATHRDLEEMVKSGRFREDLYFRLRVAEIRLPPLRERRGDIPLLARHFTTRIERDLHREPVILSRSALDALQQHDWPGNVRELEHALHRALVLARGPVIDVEHLMLAIRHTDKHPVASPDDRSLAAVERAHLVRVLHDAGGNRRAAARVLRISRPRLERLIQRHDILASEYDAGGSIS